MRINQKQPLLTSDVLSKDILLGILLILAYDETIKKNIVFVFKIMIGLTPPPFACYVRVSRGTSVAVAVVCCLLAIPGTLTALQWQKKSGPFHVRDFSVSK